MSSKLIVALDFDNQREALSLIEQLDPSLCALKVGSQLFTHLGPDFIKNLVHKHYKVFLDLKFHDIPNTVAKACTAAADLGVWMLTLHASGGLVMMKAAVESLEIYGDSRPLLVAVTALTSLSESSLHEMGVNQSLEQYVKHLAVLSKEAGLDGVVSSVREVSMIKAVCGNDFLNVTPGIRLADSTDDQVRSATPQQACEVGSDYCVVGRPITQSKNPDMVVRELLKSLA